MQGDVHETRSSRTSRAHPRWSDVEELFMSTTKERKIRTEQEMELEMEDRQNARREHEREGLEELNQGFQTGTYDSRKTGVKWGPSYRARKRARKPQPKD